MRGGLTTQDGDTDDLKVDRFVGAIGELRDADG